MTQFKAKTPGRYLSMTVNGRNISIHDSVILEPGETMNKPDGAFILMIVESPDNEESDESR